MLRRLFFLSIFLVFQLSCVSFAQDNYSVRIVIDTDTATDIDAGSGVLLDATTVLTASHVLNPNSGEYSAESIKRIRVYEYNSPSGVPYLWSGGQTEDLKGFSDITQCSNLDCATFKLEGAGIPRTLPNACSSDVDFTREFQAYVFINGRHPHKKRLSFHREEDGEYYFVGDATKGESGSPVYQGSKLFGIIVERVSEGGSRAFVKVLPIDAMGSAVTQSCNTGELCRMQGQIRERIEAISFPETTSPVLSNALQRYVGSDDYQYPQFANACLGAALAGVGDAIEKPVNGSMGLPPEICAAGEPSTSVLIFLKPNKLFDPSQTASHENPNVFAVDCRQTLQLACGTHHTPLAGSFRSELIEIVEMITAMQEKTASYSMGAMNEELAGCFPEQIDDNIKEAFCRSISHSSLWGIEMPMGIVPMANQMPTSGVPVVNFGYHDLDQGRRRRNIDACMSQEHFSNEGAFQLVPVQASPILYVPRNEQHLTIMQQYLGPNFDRTLADVSFPPYSNFQDLPTE